MPQRDDILRSALALSEDERAQLAIAILESLEGSFGGDVEDAWADEVAERLQDLADGKAGTIPAREALARARARIQRHH